MTRKDGWKYYEQRRNLGRIGEKEETTRRAGGKEAKERSRRE